MSKNDSSPIVVHIVERAQRAYAGPSCEAFLPSDRSSSQLLKTAAKDQLGVSSGEGTIRVR